MIKTTKRTKTTTNDGTFPDRLRQQVKRTITFRPHRDAVIDSIIENIAARKRVANSASTQEARQIMNDVKDC